MCPGGRWPRLVGGLWREVNYTVTRLMHSECGRICRGAVGEGGLIRGGLLYMNAMTHSKFITLKIAMEQISCLLKSLGPK